MFVSEDGVCLCSSSWLGAHCADHAGLSVCQPNQKAQGWWPESPFEWQLRGRKRCFGNALSSKCISYLATSTPTSVLKATTGGILRAHCRTWLPVGCFHRYCTLLKALRGMVVNFSRIFSVMFQPIEHFKTFQKNLSQVKWSTVQDGQSWAFYLVSVIIWVTPPQ